MTKQEELTYKVSKLREIMLDRNLDGIFIKRQDDFAWLSCGGRNYVGVGDMGNCGLLVTADKCYAVSNNIERPRMIDENMLPEGDLFREIDLHRGEKSEPLRDLSVE